MRGQAGFFDVDERLKELSASRARRRRRSMTDALDDDPFGDEKRNKRAFVEVGETASD